MPEETVREESLEPTRKDRISRQMQAYYGINWEDLEWEEYQVLWERLLEVEDSVKWGQALLCAAVETSYGEESIKAFAQDIGMGESTAYRLRRTWLAFPNPDERFPDLSFGHHAIAARTNDPHYWIEDASLHNLSVRALERKVRDAERKTKAELIERTQDAIENNGPPPDESSIELPPNHNVPLSPTHPPTFPVEEAKVVSEEIEERCARFVYDCLEDGFLVKDIRSVMRAILRKLEGKQ